MEKNIPTIKDATKELFWYIYPIYADETLGKVGYAILVDINKVIKSAGERKATPENCMELKTYFTYQQANITIRNELTEEVKNFFLTEINERLEILETGITRDDRPSYQTKSDANLEPSMQDRVVIARKRWEMWGYKNRPINTDTDTLEGYLRRIPGIGCISFLDLMETYGTAILNKFYHPEKHHFKDEDEAFKFVKQCYIKTIDNFVFVQLTTNPPTEQVIVNMYEEDDDEPKTATATFVVYPEQEESYSKVD